MLSAALLLAAATPSGLDKAFARAAKALDTQPSVAFVYTLHKVDSDEVKLAIRYWKTGEDQRFEIANEETAWVKGYKLGSRFLMLFPTQKQFIDSQDNELWKENGGAAESTLEPNTWQFEFEMREGFRLVSNPPFRVQTQGLLKEGGENVRVVRFKMDRTDGSGAITGKALFSERTHEFLSAELEQTGVEEATYEIHRDKYDLAPSDPSVFRFDPKEVEGFERLIGGKE